MKAVDMSDMITKVRHIGVIVNDVEKSVEILKNLFDVKDEVIQFFPPLDTEAESRFVFIPVAGIELELIQLSEHSQKRHPVEEINHIAFVVKDIEESVRLLERKGVRPGHVTKEGIINMGGQYGRGRSKIVYLDPETTGGILIELVEPLEPARPKKGK